ncbi:hypothetical protein EMCG_02865 [[Emmonsia] crescens]|uniref:Uncharacterized protein n=1 Tax=[Emmonsia] crescens TaxID=73230 RepID=A0A0G2HY72_9EURO|nr:hypothetical protein EMCG_02865 [Emmonsia crescens UAMH 3008]
MATTASPETFHAISTVAVKPEHAELLKYWDELSQVVRSREPDCLTFRSRAAYDAHVASSHVAESFGKWMHLLDGEFSFQRSENGTVGGWQESA